MKELKELTFPPEAEEMAIKYAAFDIMKQLNKEGKITDEELRYIAKNAISPLSKQDNNFIIKLYRVSMVRLDEGMRGAKWQEELLSTPVFRQSMRRRSLHSRIRCSTMMIY